MSCPWDGRESTFNKLYRDRRLRAVAAHEPFPDFHTAQAKLHEAVASGQTNPEKFWNSVFNDKSPLLPRTPVERQIPPIKEINRQKVDRADALEELRYRRALAAKHFRPAPKTCEACGRIAPIMLDHCHKTGALRGWLCNRCNVMLGHARDDVTVLTKLARYLRRNKT